MPGDGTRDARRTERYLDGLVAADERRVADTPADADLDPAIRLAARELRRGLTRVHPSFRFEESLAAKLSEGATRIKAGLPPQEAASVLGPGTIAPFRRSRGLTVGLAAGVAAEMATEPLASLRTGSRIRPVWPSAALRHLPDRAAHSSRPFIVGGVGVGVASAAISLGAVYVAWRHSHPASGRMGRAVREAHSRAAHAGHGRRAGVINGILGVVS